tara:strand:- start:5556 stop:5690 length:135 start_codon:yes stop_codon:yes gene_type:complete
MSGILKNIEIEKINIKFLNNLELRNSIPFTKVKWFKGSRNRGIR